MGWHISVFRQMNGGEAPAMRGDSPGERLIVWQASFDGLKWLDDLVKDGRAKHLATGGYPSEYSAQMRDISLYLQGEPPHAKKSWSFGLGDVLGAKWEGSTTRDAQVIAACRPDEWLMIQAWDES